jgi:hypothetical protein
LGAMVVLLVVIVVLLVVCPLSAGHSTSAHARGVIRAVARSSADPPNHLVGQPLDDPVAVGVVQHQDEVGRAGLDERLQRRDRRREIVIVDPRLHRQAS